ncbi:MAG TPA: DegT/DnrJ/EryC1/StrS family aminotransferase, partial [bacterium]|nr:DegT/DnrJ/EryC1/StrS family aminotransferase [bacterium]
MKVPFVDLRAQYETIKNEVHTAIANVVEDSAFIGGKYVEAFEKDFAEFCGARYAVGVSSGTSALHLALVGLRIGPGDEVIVPANTFIATTEAVSHAGATFKLVDMNPTNFEIDVSAIEAAITPRTKAVIPVHLYGQMAEMDSVLAIARKHKLAVIEDAAQAQGAEWKGKRAGSFGDAAGFSFYPAKNLGAYGDAGIVVTDKQEVADRVRLFANHGRRSSNDHEVEGFNARLDGIQAAVLRAKLPHLTEWNQKRHQAAERYDRLLAGLKVTVPKEMKDARHIYHLYVIRVKDRDKVKAALEAKGIGCGLHYPIPIHLLDAYKHLGKKDGSYPATEAAARE